MAHPKVLLVANTSWYLHNFRLPLLRDLQAAGFTVHPWLVARRSPKASAHVINS